jgi:anti-sigma B factor antagonist
MSTITPILAHLDDVVVALADSHCIAISGQIDLATAPAVEAACRLAADCTSASRLDVDLSGVEFCDAAGLSVFVRLAVELRGRGSRLRLIDVPVQIIRIIRISGLAHLLG